jgi:toluene monooxygenase system ferredoxin subunit
MGYRFACTLDDCWEGEMKQVSVDGVDVLIIHAAGGSIGAFGALCPHQEIPLVEGRLEGGLLTCSAHLWEFDAVTGQGVNPDDCALQRYPVKLESEQIFVDIS